MKEYRTTAHDRIEIDLEIPDKPVYRPRWNYAMLTAVSLSGLLSIFILWTLIDLLIAL